MKHCENDACYKNDSQHNTLCSGCTNPKNEKRFSHCEPGRPMDQKFINLICAAMQSIGSEYFTTIQAANPMIISWEEPYKYEWYHKMKCYFSLSVKLEGKKWKGYFLDPEQRKDRQGFIMMGIRPDFIVHRRGLMNVINDDDNYCVIEVKRNCEECGVKKDFRVIKCMMNCHEYLYGVFIIVGEESVKTFLENGISWIKDIPHIGKLAEYIYIFTQRDANSPVEYWTLKELGEDKDGHTYC